MKIITTLSALTIINLTCLADSKSEKPASELTHNTNSNESKRADSETEAKSVTLVTTGMSCTGCSNKVTKVLNKLNGVTLQEISHQSGYIKFTFDSTKIDKAQVISAINSTGYKVTGEKLSIPVTGMTCNHCSTSLTKALDSIDGCSVTKVSHKAGLAELTIDPNKTSTKSIVDAINKTGFKAQIKSSQ